MTTVPVNDTTPLKQYTATTSQTVFAYDFWVYASTDLDVYVNSVLKTLSVDYTVSGTQQDVGGNVTFNTGLANGDKVTIARTSVRNRATGFESSGSFRAESLNMELTRLLVMVQDLARDIDRKIGHNITAVLSATAGTLPVPADGNFLKWSGANGDLVNASFVLSGLTPPSLTGNSNQYVRVNTGETNYEYRTASQVATDLGGRVKQVGEIAPTGKATADSLHLLCYGQAVSRSTYSALFTALGTAYGSGDGSTTFNVPDLRGRIPLGKDDMGGSAASRITSASTGGSNGATLGGTGGAQTHTLVTGEIPAHTHTYTTGAGGSNGTVASRTGSDSGVGGGYGPTESTGGGGAHSNTQPWQVVNYQIYAGV